MWGVPGAQRELFLTEEAVPTGVRASAAMGWRAAQQRERADLQIGHCDATISTGKFMTNGTGQGQEAAAAALHSKGKRLDGVDVIRGLCIMNVVLHHTNIRIHFAESSLGALL